jgi:hypothetical protein
MRGSIDDNGIGGFMEAILALMVVTIAVMLLSISFSLTAYDARQSNVTDELERAGQELKDIFYNDVSIWRDGMLSWTSLQVRSARPYDLPQGLSGYDVQVIALSERGDLECNIGQGHYASGNDSALSKLAEQMVMSDGSIRAGKVLIKVW